MHNFSVDIKITQQELAYVGNPRPSTVTLTEFLDTTLEALNEHTELRYAIEHKSACWFINCKVKVS